MFFEATALEMKASLLPASTHGRLPVHDVSLVKVTKSLNHLPDDRTDQLLAYAERMNLQEIRTRPVRCVGLDQVESRVDQQAIPE